MSDCLHQDALDRTRDELSQQRGLLLSFRLEGRCPPRGLQDGLGGIERRVMITLLIGESGKLIHDRVTTSYRRQVRSDPLPAPADKVDQILPPHTLFHNLQQKVWIFTHEPL